MYLASALFKHDQKPRQEYHVFKNCIQELNSVTTVGQSKQAKRTHVLCQRVACKPKDRRDMKIW